MGPNSSEHAVQEPLQAKLKRQRSVSPQGHDNSQYEFEDGFQCKRVKTTEVAEATAVEFLKQTSVPAISSDNETASTHEAVVGGKRSRSPSIDREEHENASRDVKKLKGSGLGTADGFVPTVRLMGISPVL